MNLENLREKIADGFNFASKESNDGLKNQGYREYMRGKADGYLLVLGELNSLLAKGETEDFKDGARYALDYLSDLYDGVVDTDLWAEYMTKEESK